MFKVGDKVRWSSQAAGSVKTKEGEIVAIVPQGVFPRYSVFGKANDFYIDFGRTRSPKFRIMFDGWPRDHESFMVKVNIGGGKPRLYWPRVSQLEAV